MGVDSDLPDDYTPTHEEIREALMELAEEDAHASERRGACKAYGEALAEVGTLLWTIGYHLGPDRAEGESPFGFGNDDVVGLSVVCQVGGQLTRGILDLLDVGNVYAAQALLRQIVEVEYLAQAFAEQDDVAAEWLRADRPARLKFWSPARLRKQAKGRFLREDYWRHCELGGHPTPEARLLLPHHKTMPAAFVSADFAGHLFGLWAGVVKAIGVRRAQLPDEIAAPFSKVDAAVAMWLDADDLTRVIRATHGLFVRPGGQP